MTLELIIRFLMFQNFFNSNLIKKRNNAFDLSRCLDDNDEPEENLVRQGQNLIDTMQQQPKDFDIDRLGEDFSKIDVSVEIATKKKVNVLQEIFENGQRVEKKDKTIRKQEQKVEEYREDNKENLNSIEGKKKSDKIRKRSKKNDEKKIQSNLITHYFNAVAK